MSFFNKKEEVMKIILTPYGKSLLASGKFKPEFYTFHDDDIIYDSRYGGFAEKQNDMQTRIKETTVTLRPTTAHFGIEQNLNRNKAGSQEYETLPMGQSQFNSNYVPSWDITTWFGYLENWNRSFTGKSLPTLLEFQTSSYVISAKILAEDGEVSKETEVYSDSTYLQVQENFLIIQIDEKNAPTLNENFEIELFMVENDDLGNEVLKPLSFTKRQPLIDDNGLLIEQKLFDLEEEETITPDMAEYYLDFDVDFDIDSEIFCQYVQEFEQTEERYVVPFFRCKDKTEIIQQDIYKTDDLEPKPC